MGEWVKVTIYWTNRAWFRTLGRPRKRFFGMKRELRELILSRMAESIADSVTLGAVSPTGRTACVNG